MSDFDVPAARALCDAATNGPWLYCEAEGDERINGVDLVVCRGNDYMVCGVYFEDEPDGMTADPDAAFIAAARTLLPAALDEIERLRAALGAEREACDEAAALMDRASDATFWAMRAEWRNRWAARRARDAGGKP